MKDELFILNSKLLILPTSYLLFIALTCNHFGVYIADLTR